MGKETSTLNLDKRTTISVGFLLIIVPAIFYMAGIVAKVNATEREMENVRDVILRIDERTRHIQLDVQDLKSRSE